MRWRREPEERHGTVCATGTALWVARRTDERGALQVLPNQRQHANHCTIFTVWYPLNSEYQVAAKEGGSSALVVTGYGLWVMGYA